MSIEFAQPQESRQFTDTHAIAVDVFSCLPEPGGTIEMAQIMEDLEETLESVLAALDDLWHDSLLDYTVDDGVITVIAKHPTFLKEHLALEAIKR